MILGKNRDGYTTLELSDAETTAFDQGIPVVKTTHFRGGIVEIEVKKHTVCPNVETRSFLRYLRDKTNHDKPGAAVLVNVTDALLRVQQTCQDESKNKKNSLTLLHFRAIERDLDRFVRNVGGDVPITEICEG